jgi:hypothetical protein
MKLLENLKLDKWYGIVLYIGVLLIAASFYFKPEFLEAKHIFGLGLGLIIIGIAHLMSEKYLNQVAYGYIMSTQIIKYNFVSVILIIIGIVLTALFGYKIIVYLL